MLAEVQSRCQKTPSCVGSRDRIAANLGSQFAELAVGGLKAADASEAVTDASVDARFLPTVAQTPILAFVRAGTVLETAL